MYKWKSSSIYTFSNHSCNQFVRREWNVLILHKTHNNIRMPVGRWIIAMLQEEARWLCCFHNIPYHYYYQTFLENFYYNKFPINLHIFLSLDSIARHKYYKFSAISFYFIIFILYVYLFFFYIYLHYGYTYIYNVL